MRQIMYLVQRETLCECITDIPDTFRAWFAEFFLDDFVIGRFLIHAFHTDFKPAQGFLE